MEDAEHTQRQICGVQRDEARGQESEVTGERVIIILSAQRQRAPRKSKNLTADYTDQTDSADQEYAIACMQA
jgi:hypothetical protein